MQKATNFISVISPCKADLPKSACNMPARVFLPASQIIQVRLYVKKCKSYFNDFSMRSLDEPGAIHVVVVSLGKSIGCDFPMGLSKGCVTV